jgi:hypothetical protein
MPEGNGQRSQAFMWESHYDASIAIGITVSRPSAVPTLVHIFSSLSYFKAPWSLIGEAVIGVSDHRLPLCLIDTRAARCAIWQCVRLGYLMLESFRARDEAPCTNSTVRMPMREGSTPAGTTRGVGATLPGACSG